MAGMFDFLGSDTTASTNWINPDTGSTFGGGMDTITKLLQDPNILQGMGNAGAALSSGASVGEALNPATLIRQIQTQKAGNELLKQILGSKSGTPTPTPLGTPGPDAVTTKKTADGTTTTIQEPSAANLNTYGTSVPPEATPAMSTSGGSGSSPFWQALFNQ
jgi:hypothetical protein